jgi:hypothetical protein
MEAGNGDGAAAAREPHDSGDLGHGPDLRVLALVRRHEKDALVVTDVHGQRHRHVGEDDVVLQGDQQKIRHGSPSI